MRRSEIVSFGLKKERLLRWDRLECLNRFLVLGVQWRHALWVVCSLSKASLVNNRACWWTGRCAIVELYSVDIKRRRCVWPWLPQCHTGWPATVAVCVLMESQWRAWCIKLSNEWWPWTDHNLASSSSSSSSSASAAAVVVKARQSPIRRYDATLWLHARWLLCDAIILRRFDSPAERVDYGKQPADSTFSMPFSRRFSVFAHLCAIFRLQSARSFIYIFSQRTQASWWTS